MEIEGGWSAVRRDAREAVGARADARRFLEREAAGDSDLDSVEQIIGELVANVVRHAPGPIGISVWWDHEDAMLMISDRGPGLPPVRRLPDFDCESGRGLFLVERLARAVVIQSTRGVGTNVVVRLPAHRLAVAG